MNKLRLIFCSMVLAASAQGQTTFRLDLVAEGNFGSTNGDVFVRNTMDNPATTSAGMYQTANATTGYNVLQDFVIAGNKCIFAEKPSGAGRVVIAEYPSFTTLHTFSAGGNAPQALGVASNTTAYVSMGNPASIRVIDLANNTMNPIADPNNYVTSYANGMVFANGNMYVSIAGAVVKIDTLTHTAVASINPGVGSIKGMVSDGQGKLWVIGGSSVNSIDVLNGDALGTAVNVGVSGALLEYYNDKLYFWSLSTKALYTYDVVNPILPLSPVYTSTLPGNSWSFGYGRSFDIDEETGDFVIASANNYTAPGYYEVVDGATFEVIESSSIPGCAIPNKCVLKTNHTVVGPVPVPDEASLVSIDEECEATVTAPTADNGTVMATTTDPLSYAEQGTYTITWTYTNANGTSTQTQTVVVDDQTAPDAVALNTLNIACDDEVAVPTTTDNCAGTLTATTTDPLLYATAGTYTITWSFDDGNGNTSTVEQEIVVSCSSADVAEQAQALVAVYPNPVADDLFVVVADEHIGATLLVVDLRGNVVAEEIILAETHGVDVSALASGTYFVKLGNAVSKIIVE